MGFVYIHTLPGCGARGEPEPPAAVGEGHRAARPGRRTGFFYYDY